MFPRNYKLPLRSMKDFFDEAQKFQSGFVTVFFRASHHSRVVVIVPKRVAHLSTVRNRLQRTVYAALVARLDTIVALNMDVCIVLQRLIPEHKLATSIDTLISNLQKRLVSVQ